MKPRRRRDSLEKAARKEARAIAAPAQYGWCKSEGDGIKEPGISQLQDDIAKALVRFATRHGAKVRREYEQKISDLDELTKIQCSQGNWNYDSYMHGMANGMILALATMRNEDPKFLDAPKKWLHTPRGEDRRNEIQI